MDNDTQITGKITRDLDWARHHLFLLVAVAVLTVGSVYGVESMIASRSHDQRVQDLSLFTQMQKQNEQTQADNKAEIATLVQQNISLQQQITTLSTAITARDAQLSKDRQEIKSLPPSALATKWGAAANEPAPVIAASGDFVAPLPLAQKSFDALLTVPVLSKDNADLKASLTAETQTAANNQKKFEDEQKAHNSDNETCKQNVQVLKDTIKENKDKARKQNVVVAAFSVLVGILLHR